MNFVTMIIPFLVESSNAKSTIKVNSAIPITPIRTCLRKAPGWHWFLKDADLNPSGLNYMDLKDSHYS